MSCTCTTRAANHHEAHNNQLRSFGRCRCVCHSPGYRHECASCGKTGSFELCGECGGR